MLEREGIDYELIVVDDHSTDGTAEVVDAIAAANPRVRCVRSSYEPGFGFAVRAGLDEYTGDAVAVMMADGSDHPEDLVRYHHELDEGWECVFGSRFISGATVRDYPRIKLVINRLANWFIRTIFRHHYNDTTNAFKAYRREVIDAIQPLLSNHFNLTVEMPLKAIVRGHTFRVVPISWTGRSAGRSKLGIREMGSRYLFIVLYVWLEAHLSRGDYRKREAGARDREEAAQPDPAPEPKPGHGVDAHQPIAALTQDLRELGNREGPLRPAQWLEHQISSFIFELVERTIRLRGRDQGGLAVDRRDVHHARPIRHAMVQRRPEDENVLARTGMRLDVALRREQVIRSGAAHREAIDLPPGRRDAVERGDHHSESDQGHAGGQQQSLQDRRPAPRPPQRGQRRPTPPVRARTPRGEQEHQLELGGPADEVHAGTQPERAGEGEHGGQGAIWMGADEADRREQQRRRIGGVEGPVEPERGHRHQAERIAQEEAVEVGQQRGVGELPRSEQDDRGDDRPPRRAARPRPRSRSARAVRGSGLTRSEPICLRGEQGE